MAAFPNSWSSRAACVLLNTTTKTFKTKKQNNKQHQKSPMQPKQNRNETNLCVCQRGFKKKEMKNTHKKKNLRRVAGLLQYQRIPGIQFERTD